MRQRPHQHRHNQRAAMDTHHNRIHRLRKGLNTMDIPVQITLTLDRNRINLLSSNMSRSFLHEQLDRFESSTGNGVYPTTDDALRFRDGCMSWCGTGSDALMLEAYEKACGHETLIVWDLAQAEDHYVVVSTRDWEQEMLDLIAHNKATRDNTPELR